MNETLTTAQRQELKTRLLAVRKDLQDQMQQNRENLAPPAADQDGIVQGNVGREVDQALTNIDAADLARIDHALEALEDGSYGLCGECGCSIPFERLQIEPQTQHCVACLAVQTASGEPSGPQMLAYLAADLAGRVRRMMPCRMGHQTSRGISNTRWSPRKSERYRRTAEAVGSSGVPRLHNSTAVRSAWPWV